MTNSFYLSPAITTGHHRGRGGRGSWFKSGWGLGVVPTLSPLVI